MKIIQKIRVPTDFLNLTVIILLLFVELSYGWIGFTASDDVMYTGAAEKWITSFPFLGENHWALRHPLVLSIALSYFIFGINEYALVLTTSFYFFVITLLSYFFFKKINPSFALIETLCVISLPLFAVQSTISGCDIIELFFIISSIMLFYLGNKKNKSLMLFISGLMAGFAWLTRETAAVLPIFYIILFLIGYGNRKHYWWIAAGFLSIVVTEFFIYYQTKGDILYRIWIDIDQGRSTGNHASPPGTGNIEINKLLNPILALLTNQEFMLLFIFFIPASIWLFKLKQEDPSLKTILLLFFWLAVIWFIIVGYGLGVRALPRYFSVTSYFAIIIVAAWLFALFEKNKKLSLMLFIIFFSSNFIGLYVENKQPIYGERTLLSWLMDHPDYEIYTDPETLVSAGYLLKTHNLISNAHSERPAAQNKYYLYNPNRVLQESRNAEYAGKYKPLEEWKKIEVIVPERKWLGVMLEWLKLDHYLPTNISKKLNYPADSVVIYQAQ